MKSLRTRHPLHQQDANKTERQPFFSKAKEKKDDVFFQTKLAVGDKNDKAEKEAGDVGNKVQKKEEEKKDANVQKMDKNEKEQTVQRKIADDIKGEKNKDDEKPVQKMSETDKKNEQPVQKKEQESGTEEKVMTAKPKDSHVTIAHKASLEERIKASKSRGQMLPDPVRRKMEADFNTDLSMVRIHLDSEAISMSRELRSLAFTNGFDIYFNEGQYQPDNPAGIGLIAHEITHVIQQTGISQQSSKSKK